MVRQTKAKSAASRKNRTVRRSDNPDPIDIHVGNRVRLRRNLIGISQEQLARSLDLTFQQVQKYERGTNRMGASRLVQIAMALAVPIAWFFDELPGLAGLPAGFAETGQAPLDGAPGTKGGAQARTPRDDQIAYTADTLKFVRAYQKIGDPVQRRRIYELMRSMAEPPETD